MADTATRREAVGSFNGKLFCRIARVFTTVSGGLAIAWAVASFPVFRADDPLRVAANDVLRGETFRPEQLNELRFHLNATPLTAISPVALRDVAIIRLRLAEETDTPSAKDIDDFEKALTAAIRADPNSSLLWLMACRLATFPNHDPGRALEFLAESYRTGPNEGWIAVRRQPVALRNFELLPPQLARQALAEFRRLVESGFYMVAAEIVAGPGWAVHNKLLSELAPVREPIRRAFAKVLDSKELEGATVPGIAPRTVPPS